MDIEAKAQTLLPEGKSLSEIQKLFGEASYREYFRIWTQGGETLILMKLAPGLQSASEEITNYQGPKDELPFLNVARYLAQVEIPVPQVLATDLDTGLILLQDLGDKSLEKALDNCNEAMTTFFYRQAIDLLVKLQKAGQEHPDAECIAFNRSFDATLLEWEFDHFLEYGIEDRFGLQIPREERKQLLEMGKSLAAQITEIPFGLTHRDFQSRNLLLYGYEFFLIDFQDALMGPPAYDLVALLRDSYVTLPWKTVESLVDYYLLQRTKNGLPGPRQEDFLHQFHLVTLQRKLKDTGRFQFIATVKGNPNFLPHVPASLKYVHQALTFLPEYQPLLDILKKYLKEFN